MHASMPDTEVERERKYILSYKKELDSKSEREIAKETQKRKGEKIIVFFLRKEDHSYLLVWVGLPRVVHGVQISLIESSLSLVEIRSRVVDTEDEVGILQTRLKVGFGVFQHSRHRVYE